jgi:hypothetical protein
MTKAFYLEQDKCNKEQTPNLVSMKIQFEKHQLPNYKHIEVLTLIEGKTRAYCCFFIKYILVINFKQQ